MAISHEARKKLELILDRHYEGDLLTIVALNDIIAVFDVETNSGAVVQKVETFKENEQTGNNERRLQIATQLLAGIIAGSFEHRSIERQANADNASDRARYALLHADRLIELTSGAD